MNESRFVNLVLTSLSNQAHVFKRSNIHLFGVEPAHTGAAGVNISLAVSYDYEKEVLMGASTLKQIVYANSEFWAESLQLDQILVHEESGCGVEPCLNYQQCLSSVRFASASSQYLFTATNQFRSIQV